MLKLAVPIERHPNEKRVSITPDCISPLKKMGFTVFIEKNAGYNSSFSDELYLKAGAKICKTQKELFKNAALIIKIQRPFKDMKINEFNLIESKSSFLSMIYSNRFKSDFSLLKKTSSNIFAMEMMPRISRAQSMDVLSSQSNLSGYKAVVDAASIYNKAFPLMMTSAGTVAPAKVLIIGAGVAGLQAIATAKRLGAVVFCFDVRKATKEQVESLGGNFIEVDDESSGESETGYAKEMSTKYKKKQSLLLAENITKMDIVITTALIPGKNAPILITKKMVKSMKPGSIIVDLASEFGGNCELTKHGKILDTDTCKIVGPFNLPSTVSQDASRLYSKNILNFLKNSCIDGKFNDFNWDDELVKGTCINRNKTLNKKL
tara:strand:- start:1987 stop:3114 length:1128 start_codon:yes stop_codon:yes gene_type:complete